MTAWALWLEGRLADGRVVGPWLLEHGNDPGITLWDNGLVMDELLDVWSEAGEARCVLTFGVREVTDGDRTPAARVPARDPDVVQARGEVAERVQRLAAYAFVHSHRGVLLAQLSDRTHAPGQWGLPGGGVDPGESPQDAVLREVAEESGQRVRLVGVLGVVDGHWVGRAPDGRLEDFHAVRLVWQAVCDDPTDPVVHDVGGTTAAAAWVPIEHVASLPLSDAWRDVLVDLTAPTTDGAEGSAHQP